jgi:hypothetical protein
MKKYVLIQARFDPDDPDDATRIKAYESAGKGHGADFLREAIDLKIGKVPVPETEIQAVLKKVVAYLEADVNPQPVVQNLLKEAGRFGL